MRARPLPRPSKPNSMRNLCPYGPTLMRDSVREVPFVAGGGVDYLKVSAASAWT